MLKDSAVKAIMLSRFVRSEADYFRKLTDLNKQDNKILLLGTPIHGNYGDHLIAAAEQCFLEERFPEYRFIDCTMPFSKYFYNQIVKSVKKHDIVVISGGGWLGSDWPENEVFVRRVLTSFPDNLIVILPQTVHYKSNDQFQKEGKQIYTNTKKLLFCVRDQKSYDYVISEGFSDKERALLMPDFALFYETDIHNNGTSKEISVCFRDDIEASMDPQIRNTIYSYLDKKGYAYKNVTTNVKKTVIPLKKRFAAIDAKLHEISSSRVLITDRLHAMIMAALTGTPCIAYDNSTHKVAGVFNWIKNRDNIYLLGNADDPVDTIETALTKGPCKKNPVISSDWLDLLEKKIREGLEE